MTGCDYYIDLVSAGLDNELSNEESSALTKHLNECDDCRALWNAFTAVSGAFADELEDVPDALHENVMAEIRRIEIKKRNRRTRMISTLAACAAIVILGGIGITSLPGKVSTTAGAPMSSEAAVTAAAPSAANFRIAASDEAAECEAESPAEYSVFSSDIADSVDDSFFDLRGHNCDEFLDMLLADKADFDGAFDRCVELIASRDGKDEDIIVYFSGDRIFALAPDGNCYISALNADEFNNFVFSNK